MAKKIRIKTVPATTANLTTAIVNYLLHRGHFAYRVNNGAVFDPVKKVFRRKRKGDPAISDILGTLCPSGVTIAIEVKNASTKDKTKSTQQKFREEIIRCGGVHFYADTYENFRRWYDDLIYDDGK